MNNQLRYYTNIKKTLHVLERNKDPHTMLNEKTVEKMHKHDDNNGRFLDWQFNNGLRSRYSKDLAVTSGTVQFDNGQLIMSNGCVLKYSLNKYFPKKNFMLLIKYSDNSAQGNLTIDMSGLYFTFGYSQLESKYFIYWYAIYEEDGSTQVFDTIYDYDLNANYNGHNQENEIVIVLDNDIYNDVSIFLNGEKINSQAFNDFTKNIKIDTTKAFSITHTNTSESLFKLNELVIYDVIPDNEGGLDYIRVMPILSYPTNMLMFTLDPTNVAQLTSYHNTEIVDFYNGWGEPTLTANTTINGKVAFSGWTRTNAFAYVAHEYSVALVTEITFRRTSGGVWDSWFQFDAGHLATGGAKNDGFAIEHNGQYMYNPTLFPVPSIIGGHTKNDYTFPIWDYTNYVGHPLIMYCDFIGGIIRFKVYDIMTGQLIHSTQKSGLNFSTPSTGSSHCHIGNNLVSTSEATYGDVLFYNKKLEEAEETQLINFLLNKYNDFVPNFTFRLSEAISTIANGTYDVNASITYNGLTIDNTTIPVDFPFLPEGYIIATDVNGYKSLSAKGGKCFGAFPLGTGDFTVAFILSSMGFGADRLTYGINKRDKFNCHWGTSGGTHCTCYPLLYDQPFSPPSGVPFVSAEYALFIISYSQVDNKATMIIRTTNDDAAAKWTYTRTGVNTIAVNDGYEIGNTIERTFSIVTQTGLGHRIYDLMISNEYTDTTSPYFNYLRSHCIDTYGILF